MTRRDGSAIIASGTAMDMTPQPDHWFENHVLLTRPRTRLRRPTIHDTAAVLCIFCDAPEVTRYVAWRPMRTRAEARDFLGIVISGWSELRPSWFIEDVQSGEVAGSIIAACDRDEVEISYVVAPAWWRRGHATSAVEIVTAAAFTDPTVRCVRAYCDAENVASARVLQKAGFTRDARRPTHGAHDIAPEPRDCVSFVRKRA